MFKKVLILLVISLVLGCGDSKKVMERKGEEIKKDARTEQFRKNMMKEDICLLAIKYEISEGQLMEMLIDYEKMTKGFSVTEVFKRAIFKDEPKASREQEFVDVPTALNRISEKYGTTKKTLSTIILEKKMLTVSSSD